MKQSIFKNKIFRIVLSVLLVGATATYGFFNHSKQAKAGPCANPAHWTGGFDGKWSDGFNWTESLPPCANANLIFPSGAANLNNSNDLGNPFAINSITFTGTGYTLNGGELDVGVGGVTDNSTGGANTIAATMVLLAPQSLMVTNAGETFVNGTSIGLNGNQLTFAGAGDSVMSGSIGGAGGVLKNGTGTTFYYINNTYTGVTTINDGRLEIRSSSSLGTGGAGNEVHVNDGGMLALSGDGLDVVNKRLFIAGLGPSSNGALVSAGGSNMWEGNVSLDANSEINVVNSGDILELSGVISGLQGISKINSGTLTLSGANTFGGQVQIQEGAVKITFDGALGAGDGTLATGTVVSDGAELAIFGNLNVANEHLTLNGFGSGPGAMETHGSIIWGGPVVLESNSSLAAGATSLALNGVISGTGNLTVSNDGGIPTVLSALNTYTGNTMVGSGILRIGVPGAVIPAGSNLTVDFGGIFDLNNNDETIGTISGDGQITMENGSLTTNANADTTFSGVFTSTSGILTKNGTGTLTLSGASDAFAGGTVINGGAIKLQNTLAAGSGSISVNDPGKLMVDGGITLGNGISMATNTVPSIESISGDNAFSGGPGHVTLNNNTTVAVDAGTLTMGELIDEVGARSLTKTGTGSLTLGSNNSYTGSTVLNAGTTFIDGVQTASAVTLNPTATLGGTGATGVLASTGGSVAPGHSPGLLNIGNTTFNGSTQYNVEINGATAGTQYDVLNSTGTVDLGGAQLNISLGYTPAPEATFTIVHASGAISNTFNELPNGTFFTIGGQNFLINYNPHTVVLTHRNPGAYSNSSSYTGSNVSIPNGGGSAGIYQMNSGGSGGGSTSPDNTHPAAPNPPSQTQETLHGAAPAGNQTSSNEPLLQNYFSDTQGHWARAEIDDILNTCKVAGYKDKNGDLERIFKPDQQVTRAELFTMIMKCKYGPLPQPNYSPFPDLPADHWAAPYVAKGLEMGIIHGYEDGTFKPNQPISRAEGLKAILLTGFTAQDIDATSQNSQCTDIGNATWYAKYFYFALNNGIFGQNTGSAACNPLNSMIRAETAVSVVRVKHSSLMMAMAARSAREAAVAASMNPVKVKRVVVRGFAVPDVQPHKVRRAAN